MLIPRRLDRPLRVALLCSRRAPGSDHLLERDPNRGGRYQIVAALSSEAHCADLGRFERAGVPIHHHDLRGFAWSRAGKWSDLELRRDYDARTVALLAPYRPDVVLLCGYLLILTAPMLDAYAGRILNVHHADLLRTGASGEPLYPGLRAVRDALFAGEAETRSTVHWVTGEVDAGPVVARSRPFPAHPLAAWAYAAGAVDALKAYAFAHQEWMLREGWGPLMAEALERVARDRDALDARIRPAPAPALAGAAR